MYVPHWASSHRSLHALSNVAFIKLDLFVLSKAIVDDELLMLGIPVLIYPSDNHTVDWMNTTKKKTERYNHLLMWIIPKKTLVNLKLVNNKNILNDHHYDNILNKFYYDWEYGFNLISITGSPCMPQTKKKEKRICIFLTGLKAKCCYNELPSWL